ncbi:MAG: type II toxin-antitoxin system VapB family antitoxin [Chthoniobacterales bacterium]
MKMTMHIDEELLANVMEATGARSKTEAVDLALREVSRRVRQKKLFATPIEIKGKKPEDVFDFETYDALKAAEPVPKYGTRRRR